MKSIPNLNWNYIDLIGISIAYPDWRGVFKQCKSNSATMPVVKMQTEAKNFIVRLTPEKPNENKEGVREKQKN